MSGSIPVHTPPCILQGFRQLKGVPSVICVSACSASANRVSSLGLSAIDILGQTILCCVGCLAASLVSTH